MARFSGGEAQGGKACAKQEKTALSGKQSAAATPLMTNDSRFGTACDVGDYGCMFNNNVGALTRIGGMDASEAAVFRPWYCHRIHGTMIRHTGGNLDSDVVYTHLQPTDCDCTPPPPSPPTRSPHQCIQAIGGLAEDSHARHLFPGCSSSHQCCGSPVSVVVVSPSSAELKGACWPVVPSTVIPVVHPVAHLTPVP